jgi:hypothetical protein
MYNKNLDKMNKKALLMQKLAGIITENEYKTKLNELDSDSVTIKFTPEPFTVIFDVDDFDDEEEFEEFKNKLMSDEQFAYDEFFGNFGGQDFEDQLDRQNQDNWKIEIE